MKRIAIGVLSTLLFAAGMPQRTADGSDVRHLVLVTMDGVRVDDMFGGLDLPVLASRLESGEKLENNTTYRRYWAPTRAERRAKLMPFLWGTLLREHGFIVGDPESPARERLLNRHRSSYPGYSEILTGTAHDDVIVDNDAGQNPYPSVLEYLRERLRLPAAEVAVFASWGTLHHVVEHTPGSIFVNAGRDAYPDPDPAVNEASRLQFDVPTESEIIRPDACTFELAMAHLRKHHPRVLYIAFDETDGLAHAGRYADVLEAMARTDRWLRRLWDTLQSDPEYRNRTVLVVTVDHGRGRGPQHWSEHGDQTPDAQDVWTAFMVPGSRRRGIQSEPHTLVHAQLAATLATLMGVDYRQRNPAAAPAAVELF